MAKTGPKGPWIQIDWLTFEKLCSMHCTLIEVAEFFNCSEDTIERHVKRHYKMNFADVFKRKSSKGKISLRRIMWEKAQAGNVTMMIWLSKQLLGYSDKVEQKDITPISDKQITVNFNNVKDILKKIEDEC